MNFNLTTPTLASTRSTATNFSLTIAKYLSLNALQPQPFLPHRTYTSPTSATSNNLDPRI